MYILKNAKPPQCSYYKCILFLIQFFFEKAPFKVDFIFLDFFTIRQSCVYFVCWVKAGTWSTHYVWEDVFVCTTTAHTNSPPSPPSQTN